MNDLIGLQPTFPCIPYYDGCDWKFFPYEDYFQQVRNCILGGDITSFLVSSNFTINIGPGTIEIGNIDTLINLQLVGNILTIAGNSIDLSPFYSNFMFNIFDGFNGFPIRMGSLVKIEGKDGLDFHVVGNSLTIGLPFPDAQYYIPGWPQPAVPPTEDPAYQPFNKRLVLTRDQCLQQAIWLPPQCCLQTLTFSSDGCKLNLTGGGHQDNGYTCGCGGCEPNVVSPMREGLPPEQTLCSINTDNQQLELTIDQGISEILCLSRWHGGALGVQIPDPDSCVDLIEVADEKLSIYGRDLCVGKVAEVEPNCNDCKKHCVDLSRINFTCEDVIDCVCTVPIDRVDLGVTYLDSDACSFVPALPTPPGHVDCADWGVRPTRSAQAYLRGSKVIYLGKRWTAEINCAAGDVPGTSVNWTVTSNSLWPNDAYEMFFATPRTIGSILQFLAERRGGIVHNPCTDCCSYYNHEGDITKIIETLQGYVSRMKYFAKITLMNPDPAADFGVNGNQTFRSKHTDYGGTLGRNDPRNQRWFIPNFNFAQGRHSQTHSMVSTYLYPGTLPFSHHNEISVNANGTLTIADIAYTKTMGTGYDTAPSTNNPQVNADSHFCRYGAQTITIVKNGRYSVSLQGVIEVDHNVKAFRYSCIRYNKTTGKLDLVIDSKYGGGNVVGSGSLNDPLVPRTNQRHGGGTKLMYLIAGDILFPGIKISPQTIWPKNSNSAVIKDVLHEIDENVAPVYGEHTPGSVGYPGTFNPGSLFYNYSLADGGPTVSANELPRPAANLPNIMPHFFTDTTGTHGSGGENGAEAYGWNLLYQGGYNGGDRDDYRYDDGVLTLYGPSSRFNSDGSVDAEGTSEGASLSVSRVASPEGDETERIVTP